MTWQTPLILASTSPRRRELLLEAGISSIAVSPTIDDSVFSCGKMLPKVNPRCHSNKPRLL